MRVEIPQIFWHGNRERIMSLDLHSSGLLATCGADLINQNWIRVWDLQMKNNNLVPVHIDDLAGTHERAVNVVKFSPDSNFIASGGDDCCIVVWERRKKPVFGENREIDGWGSKRLLRGHAGEIHDLCWNHDSTCIASAGMDGQVLVFHVERARVQCRLEVGKGAQGVTWHGNLIAVQSSDRTLRIYKQTKKGFYIKHAIKEYEKTKLFQDEHSSSPFFRRLSFSTDGNLLLTTAGIYNSVPVSHIFIRKQFDAPCITLPISLQDNERNYVVACRCCPVFFQTSKSAELITGLGYRIVWAVCTRDSIFIYSNEDTTPLAAITNPHFASLTDVSWPTDRILAVSSLDGYVSFVLFDKDELGIPLPDVPQSAFRFVRKAGDTKIEETEEPKPEVTNIQADGRKRIVPSILTNTN
jgi:chromatin assembly factor 1 subunit B